MNKTKTLYISGTRYTHLGFRPYVNTLDIPNNIHKEYKKLSKKDSILAKQYIINYCSKKLPCEVRIFNLMLEKEIL